MQIKREVRQTTLEAQTGDVHMNAPICNCSDLTLRALLSEEVRCLRWSTPRS